MPIQKKVMDSMQATSRKDRGNPVAIVSVTFVTGQQTGSNRWGASCTIGRVKPDDEDPTDDDSELLVLTTDTLCVISIHSFIEHFARTDDDDYYDSCDDREVMVDDSDSENDDIPLPSRTNMVKTPKMSPMRGSPWLLKDLQGVWFLSDAEPKVRLQFGSKEVFVYFTSDGERQRFRRHLAGVLRAMEDRAEEKQPEDEAKQQARKNWTVLPTDQTTMAKVKKQAKEVRARGEQLPALIDAPGN